jgi:hypothetical protein
MLIIPLLSEIIEDQLKAMGAPRAIAITGKSAYVSLGIVEPVTEQTLWFSVDRISHWRRAKGPGFRSLAVNEKFDNRRDDNRLPWVTVTQYQGT